jgi:two-component system sensor kinase
MESMTGETQPARLRRFGQRFEATRLLKSGQGVETYLGSSRLTGQPVVIKAVTASSVSASVLHRLQHEAKVLAGIQSPWLSPLLEFARDEDVYYLVVPYLPGVTLETRLRQGPLSVREAVAIGYFLLTALREAHEHGVLHQDVKPANLIVNETGPVQHLTLIDFGFARSGSLSASIRDQAAGTLQYMAPEQAGLLSQGVTERSDLYSAGIVLYETIAGRPPFHADIVGDLLRLHLTAQPPSFTSSGRTVPRALDAVVQRLLRKDPRDRYQSAAAALADLSEIGDALDRGIADPIIVVGHRDHRRTLTEPAFIGRVKELTTLAARMDHARQGQGGLILLEAESGGGKTWVLEEFAQRCERQKVWVLRGQGLDQTAQRPFQMLVGAIADFVMTTHANPRLAAEIQQRLDVHREALCAALPELAGLLAWDASAQLGPEAFGETRTLQALTALLSALGSPERPVLFLLDDSQWADELTLKLLRHWASHRDAMVHVLVVAAFRSDEIPRGHLLRSVQAVEQVILEPFTLDDVRHLVESMAGIVPPDVVKVVSQLSEGSPFMATAVLRGLVESGALVANASGWMIEPVALADLQSSRRAATFLTRRLDLLPEEVRGLLSIGSVLGKEFDLEFAAGLAGYDADRAVSAMEEARRRHMIWCPEGTRCVFVHDKLREALLQRFRDKDRKDLHRLAALRFEALHPDRIFDLAYHFDAAGEFGQALPYAMAAAQQARARHALAIAEQQYRIAERGMSDADEAVNQRISEGLGDILMLRGSYAEAKRYFEAARGFAGSKVAQAQIEGKLGDVAFRRGDVKAASEALERAVRLVGKRVPRSSMGFGIRLLWEAFVQGLHTLLPAVFLARRNGPPEQESLAIRLYSRLAYVYWFHRGKVPCAWAHFREMNQAERYPPSPELAQAYSEHAPVLTMIPWLSRGMAYAKESLLIRRRYGDLWGQGQSLHFYGVVLYAASRFEECIEKCQEAIRLLERTGDQWEVNTAAWHVAFCRYRLGDLRGAVEMARRVHQRGVELGDNQACGIALGVWAKASGGNVPRALLEAELQRGNEDVHTKAEVWQAEALWLLREGHPEEAAAALEKAQRLVRQTGLRQEYVAPVQPWLATALRQQAEQTAVWSAASRRTLLRRARQVAQGAVRLARQYRNNLPHALRESGLVAAMQGRPRRAWRFFDEAVAVAEKQGSRHELAQTLMARGRVGMSVGWPGAKEDMSRGERLLIALERARDQDTAHEDTQPADAVTVSLVDRFSTVLEVGRKIASSLSTETVLSAVREGGLKLLRGEHCAILKLGRDGAVEEYASGVSGPVGGPYSRTLVQRAVLVGRPVSMIEGTPDTSTESLVLPDIRSALCAPIFVRGQPDFCFYVSHRHTDGLFGEEEERLAEYVASLAGAAMENADGFAEIEALSQFLRRRTEALEASEKALQETRDDLERRVEQRTAEFIRAETELRKSEQRTVEALQETDRLKSALLASVSHELRTPLTSIKVMVSGLEENPTARNLNMRKEFIEAIHKEIDYLNCLVGNLLDMSRIEAGVLVPQRDWHLLEDLVDMAIRRLGKFLARRSIDIQLPEDLPAIFVDGVEIQQVLVNLFDNAVKYSDHASTIRLLASIMPAGHIEVRVSNTGPGIAPEDLHRIFERFYRVRRESGQPIVGSGLGLAICKGIIESHGGQIWAESVVGQGTTMIFTLPPLSPQGVAPPDFSLPKES